MPLPVPLKAALPSQTQVVRALGHALDEALTVLDRPNLTCITRPPVAFFSLRLSCKLTRLNPGNKHVTYYDCYYRRVISSVDYIYTLGRAATRNAFDCSWCDTLEPAHLPSPAHHWIFFLLLSLTRILGAVPQRGIIQTFCSFLPIIP
jgi:hypothetical protein